MSDGSNDDDGDEKVGYKRPPKRTRFRPGQSGNPRGRRKGVNNFGTDVRKSLKLLVAMTTPEGSRRISTQEALIFRLREQALKGDAKARDRYLSLASIYNDEPVECGAQGGLPEEDEEILEAFLGRHDALRTRSAAARNARKAASRGRPKPTKKSRTKQQSAPEGDQ